MGASFKADIAAMAKEQRIKVHEAIDATFIEYRPLIAIRAKTVHSYQNQTHQLTDKTSAVYVNVTKTLTIYSDASNRDKFYGWFVSGHYNENWFKDAVEFYSKDMAEFFTKEMSK